MAQQSKAHETSIQLQQAKTTFGLILEQRFSASDFLSEEVLMQGLNITEDDIRTATLQNNDPA